MNQPLLFSSFNYHQRAVYPLIMVSNHCCFYRSIILNATFGDCFILSNLCLFLSFNYPQRAVYIVYIKLHLLFLSFNYPQRAVWPLFILRNLCCFYRSIILDAPVSHCIYKATFFLSFNYPQRAVYIVYIKQPLLLLSFNYPQRAVWPLF